jgi:hypothetical protein
MNKFFKKSLNSLDERCSTDLDPLANEEIPIPHTMPNSLSYSQKHATCSSPLLNRPNSHPRTLI